MPPIKHTSLFDFPAYLQSMKDVKAASLDFGKSVGEVIKRIGADQKELLEALRGYAALMKQLNVTQAGAADTLKKYSGEIDTTIGNLTEMKAVQSGLAQVVNLNAAGVRELKAEYSGLKKQYEGLNPMQKDYALQVANIKKRVQEVVPLIQQHNNVLKVSKTTIDAAEGSYKRMQQELTLLKNRLKEMPNAFNEFTGKLNKNNQEALALHNRINQLDNTLKKADANMGMFTRNVGNYAIAVNRLGTGLRSLGFAVLATAGLASVSGFIHDSIAEFLEADLAGRKLESTLKNLGRADLIPVINRHIADLKTQFGFLDDEDISATFQRLIVYGELTENQIKALIPVIINFSAQTGQSLAEATGSIIKALEGNSRALKEFGIDMKDGKTQAERLAIVMDVLSVKVKDAGDTFGDSFAGEVQKARIEISDFKEESGGKMAIFFADFISGAKKAASAFDEYLAGFKAQKIQPFLRFFGFKGYSAKDLGVKEKTHTFIMPEDSSRDEDKILGFGSVDKEIKKATVNALDRLKASIAKQQDIFREASELDIKINELRLAKKEISEIEFQGRRLQSIRDFVKKAIDLENQLGKNADKSKISEFRTKEVDAELEFTKFITKQHEERSKAAIKNTKDAFDAQKKAREKEKSDIEKAHQEFADADRARYNEEIERERRVFALLTEGREASFKEKMEHLEKEKRIAIKNAQDTSDAVYQIKLLEKQREQQLEEETQQFLMDVAGAALTIIQDQHNARFEERINKLEEEKTREMELAGSNAAARERIEKDYNKRIAKEKEKQARSEKMFSLFNIAIDTAQGVAKTIAQWGMPAAIPFIALTIGQGLLQAAIVAARPIPKFKTGSKKAPAGLAEVGEEGYEFIERNGRIYVTPGKSSLVNLKGGEKIYPHSDSKRIMEEAVKSYDTNQITQSMFIQHRLADQMRRGKEMEAVYIMAEAMKHSGMNEKTIQAAFERAVEKIPVEKHIYDERGYRKRLEEMNKSTTYLNSRMS